MSALVLWLILAVVLWLLEFLVPALVGASLGSAALVVALLSRWIRDGFAQVVLFTLLGGAFILLSRRLLPKPDQDLENPGKGEIALVTAAIQPGEIGRVAFLGTTWNARCNAEERTLSPGTKVIVTGQKGNMLNVIPMDLLNE
jgi:membrane protein implicated in regulation of membrane protease activity